jgi:hypothetical protein
MRVCNLEEGVGGVGCDGICAAPRSPSRRGGVLIVPEVQRPDVDLSPLQGAPHRQSSLPRSPARKAFETILAAVAGGLGALLLISVIDPQTQVAMDTVFLIAGALAGVGLDRWLRG